METLILYIVLCYIYNAHVDANDSPGKYNSIYLFIVVEN